MKRILLLNLMLITGSIHSMDATVPSGQPTVSTLNLAAVTRQLTPPANSPEYHTPRLNSFRLNNTGTSSPRTQGAATPRPNQLSRYNPLNYSPRNLQTAIVPSLNLDPITQAIQKNNWNDVEQCLIILSTNIDSQKKTNLLGEAQRNIQKQDNALFLEQQAQIQSSLMVKWGINSIVGSGALFGLHKLMLHLSLKLKPLIGSLIADQADLNPLLDTAEYTKKGAIGLAIVGASLLSMRYIKNKFSLYMQDRECVFATLIRDAISQVPDTSIEIEELREQNHQLRVKLEETKDLSLAEKRRTHST